MNQTRCCGAGSKGETGDRYEVVRIERAKNNCHLCDDYAARQKNKPVAVICCEGACLRGEIARQAANILCHSLAPEETVRVCLGGAFTKNTGQRSLVRQATRLLALEGCFVNCSSRMMNGVLEELHPEVIIADQLYDFERTLFGIEEMPSGEIQAHARTVAEKIAARYGIGGQSLQQLAAELDYREWIEAIDAPLLVMQENPRQVVTANRKALALFGKELHDIAGHRGGQVFDCLHAFTEEGCGKDVNCDGCMIRDGIIDTFTTGRPHNGIATALQIKKAGGNLTYRVQVSTEKVGNLAFISMDYFAKA